MEKIINILQSLLEPGMVLLAIVFLLLANDWIFKRIKKVSTDSIVKRSIAFFIILLGLLILILSLPIDKILKGQILSFLGILISAGIALSSTTMLGNLIAGLMNNSMNRYRNGDLITVNEYQGRVTRKSIFHTEIQLEDSNFITIPNLYIATNPVKLTRKSDSVISTTVSLGYDVSRIKIEEALKEAATKTGLNNPYVYITNLGDYSVAYKIHGFLEDTNKFFSTSSLLNAMVMDTLHDHEIEIVSPSFMNQRRVDEMAFIPKKETPTRKAEESTSPEEKVFDEAMKSGEIEKKKDFLKETGDKINKLKEQIKEAGSDAEKEKFKSSIKRLETLSERIQERITEDESKK